MEVNQELKKRFEEMGSKELGDRIDSPIENAFFRRIEQLGKSAVGPWFDRAGYTLEFNSIGYYGGNENE